MTERKNRRWSEQVALPIAGRLEMNVRLELWKTDDEQLLKVDTGVGGCTL